MTVAEAGVSSGDGTSGTRGQSEVVGVVLVLGLVLLGAVAVVTLGANAIGGTESQLSDDRAEKTLTQFDAKAGLVALGEADSQHVSLPVDADEQYHVDEDAGHMWIEVVNLSDEDDSFEVIDTTLGAVTYEREDSTVAYQGGGVWRATESGGSMISPPEFHYRNGTLTLPAVTVTGDSSLGSNAVIRKDGEDRKFPIPGTEMRLNPLDHHRVEVTIQSEYYQGWGHYFVERTDGSVEYDHDEQKVTVTLVTPVNVNEITAASASLSAGGEFNVQGTSASTCDADNADDVYTSSYNSSLGESYCEQFDPDGDTDDLHERLPGIKGDVVYGKDIDISDGSGGSSFYGDLTSGGKVTVKDGGEGQPTVFGNISYVDGCSTEDEEDCEARIEDESGGETDEIDGVKLTESIDWFVDITTDEIQEDAETVDLDAVDTLEAGEYYFESFELGDGESLELDTSDGTIILAVREGVTLEDNAEIEVTGDDHVQLFVAGEGTGEDFVMENSANITATNNNATQFRTYGEADFEARLGGGGSGNLATYTGVIYAPPGKHGEGSVILDGAEVFGGILTGETTIDGGSIHYDEALEGERVVPDDARIIRVTYLHVSESQITVRSG